MSDDEQLQAKKDTLWEIHEQKVKIACLEKKVSDHLERWAKIAKAWGGPPARYRRWSACSEDEPQLVHSVPGDD